MPLNHYSQYQFSTKLGAVFFYAQPLRTNSIKKNKRTSLIPLSVFINSTSIFTWLHIKQKTAKAAEIYSAICNELLVPKQMLRWAKVNA